jgi:hypothetical protein
MFLKDNNSMMLEIEEQVKVVLGIKTSELVAEEVESDE